MSQSKTSDKQLWHAQLNHHNPAAVYQYLLKTLLRGKKQSLNFIWEVSSQKLFESIVEAVPNSSIKRINPSLSHTAIALEGIPKAQEQMSRYGSIYIHFKCECLKAHDTNNYYKPCKSLEYDQIVISNKNKGSIISSKHWLFFEHGYQIIT